MTSSRRSPPTGSSTLAIAPCAATHGSSFVLRTPLPQSFQVFAPAAEAAPVAELRRRAGADVALAADLVNGGSREPGGSRGYRTRIERSPTTYSQPARSA